MTPETLYQNHHKDFMPVKTQTTATVMFNYTLLDEAVYIFKILRMTQSLLTESTQNLRNTLPHTNQMSDDPKEK